MYPDLKDFRKKLNNKGPWIFEESLFRGVIFSFFYGLSFGVLNSFDQEYNKIPLIIEILFTISFILQFEYLNKKLRLGLKNEKDQIQSIIDIEDIKSSLSPLLFLRVQLRFLLLLRIPYLIISFKLLPSLSNANLMQTIAIYIFHSIFLCYDYLSYKDTIDKVTKKPIPLQSNKNQIDSGENINDLSDDITKKNTNTKKIKEFDSKKLITKLLNRNKF